MIKGTNVYIYCQCADCVGKDPRWVVFIEEENNKEQKNKKITKRKKTLHRRNTKGRGGLISTD